MKDKKYGGPCANDKDIQDHTASDVKALVMDINASLSSGSVQSESYTLTVFLKDEKGEILFQIKKEYGNFTNPIKFLIKKGIPERLLEYPKLSIKREKLYFSN